MVQDQDAAYLLVLPIDVVGPLDGEAIGIVSQSFVAGKGCQHGQAELFLSFQDGWVEHDTAKQVLPAFRFPRVPSLSFSVGLAIGHDGIELLRLAFLAELGEVVVGGSS